MQIRINYKIDGGATQTYASPFTVSGSGTHSVEYWSVDNTGLEELPHKSRTFIVNPQHAQINSITQNSTTIDINLSFDNFSAYTSQLFNNDCYNDPGASFKLYNATTGAVVSSQSGYAHCGGSSDGSSNWLGFPPLQLPSGTYFIYYHGGTNADWITDNFTYIEPAPVHEKPITSASLNSNPATPGEGLQIYTDPVTVTLSAVADTGYSIANTYYKVDGGAQQTYTAPFTVSGSGTHSIEFWSFDNTGLEELPHKSKTFIINPQSAVINKIVQGGITINVFANFENFELYTSNLYNNDCYNDPGASFEVYDAVTGARVSSQTGEAHCYSLGNPYQTLVFPPLQLPYGTYFIHYHGGNNADWITGNFVYEANNPPVLDPIGNKTVNEGELHQFTISATDPDGDNLTYSASNLPVGASFDTQTHTFTWTPGFDQEGNYPDIEFTVTDDGTPMELDMESITITVGGVNRAPIFDPIGSQEVLENELLTFTVSATDPDGDSVTLSASNLPTGASFDPQTGIFSWTPSLSQADTYVVKFHAADNGVPVETGHTDVPITVGDNPTPTEQAQDLVNIVVTYNFPTNVENSYLANLKKVEKFIEEGKIEAAINQLNAFIDKVETDYSEGIITQAERNNLVNLAQALIDDLQ